MLEVKDLLVRYGAVPALHGVSLKVAERSITSIVGSNGAGKSSVLRTIMGHEQAAEGEIFYQDEKISGLPAHTISRKGISLVPEGRGLFAKLTVQENLMLGAFAVKNRHAVEEAREWIYGLFPILRERRAQISGTLSGGEQQILSIARGLMSRPGLLMLDEPSLGVMPSYIHLIFQVLEQIREQGTTILLVEQNVERSLHVADYAYVLQTGRIVLEGKGDELLDAELIRKAYLGL
jgi:branched-chain amino acid transport system ATP-binding protein